MGRLSFRFVWLCFGVLAFTLNGCGGGGAESKSISSGAPTLTVLDDFPNLNDGATPAASLIMDSAENLFGTTQEGGSSRIGTVFKLSRNIDGSGYTKTLLHQFSGNDGANPYAALLMDSEGSLYGTTQNGGLNGNGTVFKLSFNGTGYTPTTLYSFAGGAADGANPRAAVIRDSAGNLYGTTENGGASGLGTVFRLSPDGSGNSYSESILHHFAGGDDGANPWGGLVMDSDENLYGTTVYGGGGELSGTVYKLEKQTGYTLTHLHVFQGGENPRSTLIMDGAGNLIGTSYPDSPIDNNGLVFKLSRDGSAFDMLTIFRSADNTGAPRASLIMDSAGNLYGTTLRNDFVLPFRTDTLFKISPDGQLVTLYAFSATRDPNTQLYNAGPEGSVLLAGLVMDRAGNLYGAASKGGTHARGMVFKLGD